MLEWFLPRGLALRIFAACFVGTHVPLIAYFATSQDQVSGVWTSTVLVGATAVGTVVALWAIGCMLRPLIAASDALCAYANDGAIVDLPRATSTEVRRLIESIEVVRERSEAVIGSLSRVANLDLLTNLPNRRAFVTFAQSGALGADYAVAVVDVDHFKGVNDSVGHDGGDKVLQIVARYLREGVRSGDFVARLGGEEFILVFPKTTPRQAAMIVDRIRDNLFRDAPFRVGEVPVSFSGGVCAANENDPTIDDAVRRADRLLYRAKAAGRNRIEFAPDGAPPDFPGVRAPEAVIEGDLELRPIARII